MPSIERQKVLHYLNDCWGNYINDCCALPADRQEEFQHRQGYLRLADLLAHFAAWWEVGMQVIETYRLDPDYQPPAVDVDAFNAAAVESARHLSEAQVIQLFESTRQKFVDLVLRLSDEDFRNPGITNQLQIELVNHLQEHAIKKDPVH